VRVFLIQRLWEWLSIISIFPLLKVNCVNTIVEFLLYFLSKWEHEKASLIEVYPAITTSAEKPGNVEMVNCYYSINDVI